MKIVHPRAPGIGCTEIGWWGAAATPTFVGPQDASREDNSDVYQEDQGVVHKIVPLCSLRACFLWQNVILYLYIYIYIYISYFIYWSYFIPKSVFFGGADGLTHWDSTPSPPLRCQRWSARHPGIGQKLWSTCSSCCSWGPLTPSLLGFVAGSSGRVHLEKVKVKQGKSGLNSTFPSHSSAFDWVGIQLVSFGFERKFGDFGLHHLSFPARLMALRLGELMGEMGSGGCRHFWRFWCFSLNLKGTLMRCPKKGTSPFCVSPFALGVCVRVWKALNQRVSAGGQQPIFLCCPTKLWKMWWKGSWTHEPVPALCMGFG